MATRRLDMEIAAATAMVMLGVTIMSSPWHFGLTVVRAASRDTRIVGAVICIASVTARVSFAAWEIWPRSVPDNWIANSPWAHYFNLAITDTSPRALTALGLRVAALSVLRLWMKKCDPPLISAWCAAAARRVVRSSSSRGATPCYPADRPSFGTSWLIVWNFSMAIAALLGD
jgi:hypothetical protein